MAHQDITLTTAPRDLEVNNPTWESPPLAKRVDQLSLSAATAATWTVPAGYASVLIHYTAGTLYVRSDGSAAVVPVATITNGTGSEKLIDGSTRRVYGGDTHSFINADACVITFSLYRRGAA